MGNRSSEPVAPSDIETGAGGVEATGGETPGSSGWSSWARLPNFGSEQQAEEDIDPCKILNLSYTQRMYGFVCCFTLGMVITIMSAFLIANPTKFALPYSLGNILSLLSTGFLIGPKRLCTSACASVRVVAFLIYVGSIICTLIAALHFKKLLVTLIFVITQFCAGLWFSASYIPYGRTMLTKIVNSCLGQATAAATGT